MRAEIHGADGRHAILDADGTDLDTLVEHAERLFRAASSPGRPPAAAGFVAERAAPDLGDIDDLDALNRPGTPVREWR